MPQTLARDFLLPGPVHFRRRSLKGVRLWQRSSLLPFSGLTRRGTYKRRGKRSVITRTKDRTHRARPPSHRHPTGQRPYYATLATSARPITELTSLVWSRSRGPAADVTRARHHDHEDDGVHPANTKMKIMYMCRAAAQAPSGAGAHTGEKHTSPSTSRRGWGVLSG